MLQTVARLLLQDDDGAVMDDVVDVSDLHNNTLPYVFSDDQTMSTVDWFYFSVWIVVDLLNMLMSINITRAIFYRFRERPKRKQAQAKGPHDPVSVIVPCYLPNEKHIIHSTIDWICSHVHYEGEVTLHVVYNTQRSMPAEEERLHNIHGKWHGALSRRVFVHKCEQSSSKAENLNFVVGNILLPEVERYVAIFDADHHPDPDCLSTLMGHLLLNDLDCVQGSTYIRNRRWADHAPRRPADAPPAGCGCCGAWCRSVYDFVSQVVGWGLANFIDAEFFVTYFVWMPAIELIGRTGFFGGSVALWKYRSLAQSSFSTAVQTEDIDYSARAVLAKTRIRFCPEAKSGELSPANLRAFWRQRQRWAIGWDQVSIRYFHSISAAGLNCREKAGLYYVFPGRWIACSVGIVAGIIHPIIAAVYAGYPWGPYLNAALIYGFSFYILSTTMTFFQMVYHHPVRDWPFIIIFYFAGPIYVMWQAVLVSTSLCRIVSGRDSGWVVTKRAGGDVSDLVVPGGTPKLGPRTPTGEKTMQMDGIALSRFMSPTREDSVASRLDEAEFDAPPPKAANNGFLASGNGSSKYSQML